VPNLPQDQGPNQAINSSPDFFLKEKNLWRQHFGTKCESLIFCKKIIVGGSGCSKMQMIFK